MRTVVREAAMREIRRGGQIDSVHNTIETIEKTAPGGLVNSCPKRSRGGSWTDART